MNDEINTTTPDPPLPLFQFFADLRENGFPLGVDDYCALLPILALCGGISDKGALFRRCKLLWLKDQELNPLFQRLFEQAWETERTMLDRFKTERFTQSQPAAEPDASNTTHSGDSGLSDHGPMPPPVPKQEQKEAQPTETRESPEKGLVKISIEPNEAEADLPIKRTDETAQNRVYVTSGGWPALKERDIAQRLRFLRFMEKGNPLDVVDIKATVRQIAREGRYMGPAWAEGRRNASRLLIYIDHGGSMAAFSDIADMIVGSARLDRAAEVYYFYNLPGEHVWLDQAHTRPVPTKKLAEALKRPHTRLLIVSDAGAARGRYTAWRVEETARWLSSLSAPSNHIAWINPLPAWRWKSTSAADIALFAPMFEASLPGLRDAVRFLRGAAPKNKAV